MLSMVWKTGVADELREAAGSLRSVQPKGYSAAAYASYTVSRTCAVNSVRVAAGSMSRRSGSMARVKAGTSAVSGLSRPAIGAPTTTSSASP